MLQNQFFILWRCQANMVLMQPWHIVLEIQLFQSTNMTDLS